MPQQANQPLPAGYVLNGYRIEKPLSSGGFSIVYLARDEKDTPYAIKEYLPSSLPLRTDGVEVTIDEANLSLFRHGLKCFFEEGRALAMISHPNVVRVENFFRANETCYMVMQYVRGRTLQFHIQRHRHEFNENFIRRLFAHLMNGLREVHARKLLHLDIKPANIFIAMEGRPVLLDFGAARITLSEEASKLKPILDKHGLDLVSGWYSTFLIERDADAEFAAPAAHRKLLKDMGCTIFIAAECTRTAYG